MQRFPRPLASVLVLALAALAAGPLSATTYVMVADEDLADQAAVIAEVRVAAVEPAPAGGRPATDYLVDVERLIQGNLPGSSIVVRVPGGATAGGLSLKIWGAPEFAPGQRALLFLAPGEDGAFRILHLMLGAFYEVRWNGSRVALRNLEEAREVTLPGKEAAAEQAKGPRDLSRFADWLADRAAGRRRAPDYFVAPGGLASIRLPFTFFTRDGLRIRWFEFDEGGTVAFRSHTSGQPGVAGGAHTEFQRGLAAWNDDPGTNVAYTYAGQTTATGGLDVFDDINAIAFERPLEDPFSCFTGGVLARGGPWFDPDFRGTYKGETFIRSLGADIETNAGISCFFDRSASPSKAAEELFGHELGHTLGLGHACGDAGSGSCSSSAVRNDALMRATVHDDGRGARLNSDDRAGLAQLYGTPGGGGGRPQAPGGLAGSLDLLTAQLTWQDRSTNEQGFRVYRGIGGASLTLLATLPAGTTSFADPGLAPGTRYDYQVSAFNDQGESSRSNKVTLTTTQARPVSVVLQAVAPAATGQVVHFQAVFSGPVERAEWDLGDLGRGFSDQPCAPGRFCAGHIYTIPGTYLVKVKVIGDAGQTDEFTGSVIIGGPPVDLAGTDSFLQSVIFGPRGATGTFKSDVWLHNAGAFDTLVGIVYLPRGAGNPNPQRRTVTLPPGSSVFLPNLLSRLFGETNEQGSIALEYRQPLAAGGTPPQVFAFSRSYVEADGGSFGQLVEEEPESTWTAGEKVVAGVLQGSGFASTLLAANLDSAGGRVNIELRDALGQAVGAPASFALGPRTMRFQTLGNLFPGLAGHPGPFTARFTSTGIRFAASATLLETGSQDQIFIPAAPPPPAEGSLDPNTSQGELFLPRVVRNRGQFNTSLVSKLVVWNPTDKRRDLTIALWLRGQDNSSPRFVVRTLEPNASLLVDDVMKDLFGLDEGTGALRILWSGPTGPGPRILSLAFAETSGGQGKRFGMLVDSRRALVSGSTRTVDFGAEQTAVSRSSYGIVNLNAGGTSVRVTVKDALGTELAATTLNLKPRQHLERTLGGIFPGLGQGSNWFVETEVISGGEVLTYLANINATGDVFYVPGRPLE